jgi:PRTRC genetic system ThiF family protein
MTIGLDLSYAEARPLLIRKAKSIHLVQVGAGGTGSWLFPACVRLVRTLQQSGQGTELHLVDFDIVEEKNLLRQNFCAAELGLFKAEALTFRYGAAWGLSLNTITKPFQASMIQPLTIGDSLVILIGCVDNAKARQQMHQALSFNKKEQAPVVWWLDSGNCSRSGQVLLGSTPDTQTLRLAFNTPGNNYCGLLPSPGLQHPELLIEEKSPVLEANLSCAELALRDAQSLTINQSQAAIMAEYLLDLLIAGDLRRFATYFDAASGTQRSKYTTSQQVASAVEKS